MNQESKIALKNDLPLILEKLRRNGVRNAYAIQDLTTWFDSSKFFYSYQDDQISYVLITGHPASANSITLVADGNSSAVATLLKMANVTEPCVIRETPAHLLPVIKDQYPEAKVYLEQRMDVTKDSFTPQHKGLARRLSTDDAAHLAQFFGAPPQAAANFKGWLGGAKAFFGVFEKDRLVSIGSSMVAIPEAWNLVAIETHKEFRGKGYATEVTSALVEAALQNTETVTLTVVKGNSPALRTYEKIGFKFAEDRIWVDNGTGSAP